MADTETLRGLLERVRAATGPDNRLSQILFAHFRGWSYPLHGAALYEYRRANHDALYTERLDAALAAVADQLPGAHWSYDSLIGTARIIPSEHDPDFYDIATTSEVYDSAPLAILDALLQALLAQAEGGEHV